jgi:hypothetical protein
MKVLDAVPDVAGLLVLAVAMKKSLSKEKESRKSAFDIFVTSGEAKWHEYSMSKQGDGGFEVLPIV